jgi:hypothetical protein
MSKAGRGEAPASLREFPPADHRPAPADSVPSVDISGSLCAYLRVYGLMGRLRSFAGEDCLWGPPAPLFTRVGGISVLRTSRRGGSRKLAATNIHRVTRQWRISLLAVMEIRLLAEALAPPEVYVSNRCVGRKPRKGAGPLPALLLDRGPLPPTILCLSLGGRKEPRVVRGLDHHPRNGDTPSTGPVADRVALHFANRVIPPRRTPPTTDSQPREEDER